MDITSAVTSLGNDYTSKVTQAIKSATDSNSSGSTVNKSESFDSIYKAVSGLLNDTNQYIQEAQQAEVDFALGNMTNAHELGVYQKKANLALQYTVAIRDKAIEAYKEIMNMSI